MQGGTRAQIILIAGATFLSVALYLAPQKPAPGKKMSLKPGEANQAFNFDDLLLYQQKNLNAVESEKTKNWLSELKQPASRVDLSLYDSLAKIWDDKKMFALAAYYYEQKAEKDHKEKSFINASYRYFDAYKSAIDSSLKSAMADKAIKNYMHVTELNPQNLDAKTDLGILYAEASTEPMKGIMMLREVVAQNPDHENAQLSLGFLSIKSSQFDKALERFSKVLQINPKRIDVYLFKAQTYEQMGNKQKAIEEFEHFNQASADSEMIDEVKKHISELKGN